MKMLGILYLIIAFITGFVICKLALPELDKITQKTFAGREIALCPYLVLVPAWFTIGTILLTWTTYIFANVFSASDNPLGKANTVAMILMLLICAVGVLILFRQDRLSLIKPEKKSWTKAETILFICSAVLVYELMWTTLFVSHNQLYVGLSVFSDFSPHLGMIRSFSYGNNFPTTYSHFAGSDIKYHFMFQFLVGNLEFLGLRIDLAMNIPSMLGMLSTIALLYVLAIKLSGKRMTGVLSCVFFLFRSSKSLFTYLAGIPKGSDTVEELLLNTSFIGYTTHEDWGLWNLNVYCNQRHLAFSISILLIILMLFIPRLYDMIGRIKKTELESPSVWQYIRLSLFSKEGWLMENPRLAVAAGVLLGSIAFFNGAVLIAALAVLFVIAIFSDRRLEFLVTAMIAVCMSFIQSGCFIDGSAVTPEFYFGFIAENRTFWGVIDYIQRLLGIMPLLLIMSFATLKGARRYVLAAFLAPFILAFTLSLTIDVTVNHKYIMISVMLLNIFVAVFITKLYENKKKILQILCIIMIFAMTATGAYDFLTVMQRNAPKNNLTFNLDDELTMWVKENADAQDIFLTSNYALTPLVLGGAQLYLGWQYFGWSAGYDTDGRLREVIKMYEADTPEELQSLITKNNIRYIVVDNDNRVSADYTVNEGNIAATYEIAYETGSGEWRTAIYDTQKPLLE